MNENAKVLAKANKKCLETAMNLGLDTDEGRAAYKLAMDGIDREAKFNDEELRKKETKNNNIMRGIEIGAGILLTPIIEFATKKVFAKMICNFEKDYTFTTSAGRSLSGFFRFKK